MYHLHHQCDKNWGARDLGYVLRLVATANIVPSSPILDTLMMEAIHPLKRWFLQEPHDILHIHRPENLKSYTAFTDWAL
jgi:hypothetical protein